MEQRTKAQIRAELEQKLARIKELERKDETRKKILVGSFVLSKTKDPLQITGFADSLKRNSDRRLFNLPPLKNESNSNENG